MPPRFDAVVFDFDYTLVDSSRGVVICLNHAFSELGLPPVEAERVCRTIGLPLGDMLVELAGPEQAHHEEEFRRAWRLKADEVMNANTVLLPQTRQAVADLRRCGARLGIVSTKYRYRIEDYLRGETALSFAPVEGLLARFDTIVGMEDVPAPKPDPTGLLLAVSRLAAARERSLYVGDNVVDAQTAEQAGVPFAAVLTGTTSREAFAAHPSVAVLASLAELPALVCGDVCQ